MMRRIHSSQPTSLRKCWSVFTCKVFPPTALERGVFSFVCEGLEFGTAGMLGLGMGDSGAREPQSGDAGVWCGGLAFGTEGMLSAKTWSGSFLIAGL